jgi:hypothetical protein
MRLAIVLVAAGALLSPAAAQACSCIAVDDQTRLRMSDAAVVVRLLEVVPRSDAVADYRYRVREVYKGKRRLSPGETLTIRAGRDSASCGLPRGEGRLYGLFLHRVDRRWTASLCDVISPRGMRRTAAAANRRVSTIGQALDFRFGKPQIAAFLPRGCGAFSSAAVRRLAVHPLPWRT